MSEESVEVVREATEALGTRGLDAWAEFLADDIDYRPIEGAPDDHGVMHGRERVRTYLAEWFEMFDGFKIEPTEFIDAGGDEVVMVLQFGGRARLSGVETKQTAAIHYTVRDGKMTRAREYATREEALEAAGLSE
jgi:ketosteroid isomerase-like protein